MNNTKLTLAIVIVAAAAAMIIAPSLASTVFAASPKHQVCPGTGTCNGQSGSNNPNAYCTTNGSNRPSCGNL